MFHNDIDTDNTDINTKRYLISSRDILQRLELIDAISSGIEGLESPVGKLGTAHWLELDRHVIIVTEEDDGVSLEVFDQSFADFNGEDLYPAHHIYQENDSLEWEIIDDTTQPTNLDFTAVTNVFYLEDYELAEYIKEHIPVPPQCDNCSNH